MDTGRTEAAKQERDRKKRKIPGYSGSTSWRGRGRAGFGEMEKTKVKWMVG